MYLVTASAAIENDSTENGGRPYMAIETLDALYFDSHACMIEWLTKNGVPSDVARYHDQWVDTTMPEGWTPEQWTPCLYQWGRWYSDAGDSCEYCPTCEELVLSGTEHCICGCQDRADGAA